MIAARFAGRPRHECTSTTAGNGFFPAGSFSSPAIVGPPPVLSKRTRLSPARAPGACQTSAASASQSGHLVDALADRAAARSSSAPAALRHSLSLGKFTTPAGRKRKRDMMKRTLFAAALLSIAAGPALAASPFSAIFAFGDSLSDAGNLSLLTHGAEPVSPPYYQYSVAPGITPSVFSNGPVWVQDLSQDLGLGPLLPSLAGGNDFAIGGARTGATDLGPAAQIDLPGQVAAFSALHSNPAANAGALFTLSIGANDVIAVLEALGGGTISFNDATTIVGQAAATYFASLFNADVLQDLAPVEAAGLTIYDLHMFNLLTEIVADPGGFGLVDAADPCWTGSSDSDSGTVCSTPDDYLFWDHLHPTAAGHELVAEAALAAIPEPSTWVLTLAGFFGLGLLIVRRAGPAHPRAG